MEQKYRVNELAKDLNVSTGEITKLVQEYFGVQKKAQASLSEEELSVVLEKYSQKNQVKNFNSYFASAAKAKEEKPAAKKTTAKKTTAKKAAEKTDEEKPAAKKAPAKTTAKKAEESK